MSSLTRRHFVGLGLAAPVFAAGVSSGLSRVLAQDLGNALRVATWGGSWRDSIDAHIASHLIEDGVSIEYFLGNPEDNLARLIAASRQGEVPFDVMEGFPHITGPMAEAGLIQALNYDNMPNAAAAPEYARSQHEVVSVFTQDGVVYNTERFAEAGIEPPKTYKDLANPALAGKVAFPDIGNAQHWNAVVGMAYESGGDESDLSGAVAMVNEVAPAYFFSASTDLATRFGAGDIWAAAWHAGWAARLRRSDVPVAIGYTPFGDSRGALWAVPDYIVTDTPHQAAAEAFVDAFFTPEGQYEHSKATGCVPVISEARARLAEDELSDELLLLTDEEMEQAYQIDWTKLDVDAWRQTWEREVNR